MDARQTLLAALLALTAACSGGARGERLSVLVITLDTTNASALSCYGAPAGLTPNLDRLAAEGLLFENGRTVAPLTMPAHSSVITGLTPLRHTVRRNSSSVLPPGARTLAEIAGEHDYQSAAFIAAVVLNEHFGLGQGFDLYDDPDVPERIEEHLDSRPASEIVDAALAWLGRRDRDRPFLMWTHFFDPHFPYDPQPEFTARAGGDPYLAEVAAMDAQIGRLVAGLKREGVFDETLIVVVGDHGEGRGRHGEDTHAAFVFDSTLRVPLFLRHPRGLRAGERSTIPASVTDVLPTVARALGWGDPGDVDGADLFDPALDPTRGTYFESYFGTVTFGWSQLAGWADAEGKYIHSSSPEFYDLRSDPGETQNLLRERSSDVDRFVRELDRLSSLPRLETARLDDGQLDLLTEIERLGYAGADMEGKGTPEPLERSNRPSPHARVRAYEDYMAARKLQEEGGSEEEAVRLLRGVVAGNPDNHKAQFFLGMGLKALGRWPEAVIAYRQALAHPGGERIPAELNLAVCLWNMGDFQQAVTQLETTLRDTDGPPGALELLVQFLSDPRVGRQAEVPALQARIRARGR